MRKVPEEQILTRLRTENPWWETGAIPRSLARLTPRPYIDLFYPLVRQEDVRRSVVLLGPRRVGKTVLAHHAIQGLLAEGVSPRRIAYFSIDHPLYNGLGLDDFLRLFREAVGIDSLSERTYVFFDEVQYLRDWEVHLKVLVDEHEAVRAVASGSAAAALRLKSRESGAGRFTDFLLPPLTFFEYLALLERDHFVEMTDDGPKVSEIDEFNRAFVHYLNFGGYPEVLFSTEIQANPGRFIKADIVEKVLLRDLPSLYGIQDIQELNSLFTTLAFNTAGEVSLEGLSKNSGVSKNTLKKYIEYLEAAFLLKIVHRVDRTAKRFKRANFFKVYLTNPSMRAALFAPVDADDPSIGSLVETAIFAQLFHRELRDVHYARWQRGEVDLVELDWSGKAKRVLEVKWSDRYLRDPHALKSLLSFCRSNEVSNATVTTRTNWGTVFVDPTYLHFRPASLHCYLLGAESLLLRRFPLNLDPSPPIPYSEGSPRRGAIP